LRAKSPARGQVLRLRTLFPAPPARPLSKAARRASSPRIISSAQTCLHISISHQATTSATSGSIRAPLLLPPPPAARTSRSPGRHSQHHLRVENRRVYVASFRACHEAKPEETCRARRYLRHSPPRRAPRRAASLPTGGGAIRPVVDLSSRAIPCWPDHADPRRVVPAHASQWRGCWRGAPCPRRLADHLS